MALSSCSLTFLKAAASQKMKEPAAYLHTRLIRFQIRVTKLAIG